MTFFLYTVIIIIQFLYIKFILYKIIKNSKKRFKIQFLFKNLKHVIQYYNKQYIFFFFFINI